MISTDLLSREPDRVITSIEVKGVNCSTKHTESEVTSILNPDYESVAIDGVKSPNTTHAIQTAATESTLYEQIHYCVCLQIMAEEYSMNPLLLVTIVYMFSTCL